MNFDPKQFRGFSSKRENSWNITPDHSKHSLTSQNKCGAFPFLRRDHCATAEADILPGAGQLTNILLSRHEPVQGYLQRTEKIREEKGGPYRLNAETSRSHLRVPSGHRDRLDPRLSYLELTTRAPLQQAPGTPAHTSSWAWRAKNGLELGRIHMAYWTTNGLLDRRATLPPPRRAPPPSKICRPLAFVGGLSTRALSYRSRLLFPVHCSGCCRVRFDEFDRCCCRHNGR